MIPISEIILKHVCPTAGGIAATLMFTAPVKDAYRAAFVCGRLGEDLNPIPWAFMLGNCYGWVFYGILINNLYVYCANAPGFLIAIWLNLQAVKMQYKEFYETAWRRILPQLEARDSTEETQFSYSPEAGQNLRKLDMQQILSSLIQSRVETKPPLIQEALCLILVFVWLVLSTFVALVDLSFDVKQLLVGLAVNLNLVVFYGAPLSTIYTVLSTQSSVSIHVPTMLTNTANGSFWFAYGIAVRDWFIMIPNGAGAFLGIIQILLRLVFPARRRGEPGMTHKGSDA